MSMSRSELYGESIFTSFRSFNGKVPLLEQHFERLYFGANTYFFDKRLSFGEFKTQFIIKLKIKSKIKQNPDSYFRITLTASKQEQIVTTKFSVGDIDINLNVTQPQPLEFSAKKLSLGPSPFSEYFIPIKSGSYFQNFLSKQTALKQRCDDVLFERDGVVLEASTSNLVLVKEGIFYTPKARGILPGICLQVVSSYCKENSFKFIEEEIKVSNLSDFDMAFLSNSIGLLTPVDSIEDNTFDKVGSLKLSQSFKDYVYNGSWK